MSKVSQAHLNARRDSIINAACRAFSEKGVETTTMAEVAAMAGISPGAIYRYFDNKEALATACLGESADAILNQWVQNPETSDNPAAELGELARMTFALLNEPSERANTILTMERMLTLLRDEDEGGLDDFRQEFLKVTSGIQSRLILARQAGQFPAGLDPNAVAGMLFSLYWGARITRAFLPDADTDAQVDAAGKLIWDRESVASK
ncbi:MAG: TetR/AcrR family transcriptional regulator [Tepidiformaceae bacterium]